MGDPLGCAEGVCYRRVALCFFCLLYLLCINKYIENTTKYKTYMKQYINPPNSVHATSVCYQGRPACSACGAWLPDRRSHGTCIAKRPLPVPDSPIPRLPGENKCP